MQSATCPNCNRDLPHRTIRDIRMRRVCPHCKALMRQRTGLLIAVIVMLPVAFIASSIALNSIGRRFGFETCALVSNLAIYMAVAFYFIPKLTKYSLISDHPHCINCHYNLYNRETQTCPECGKQQHRNTVQN